MSRFILRDTTTEAVERSPELVALYEAIADKMGLSDPHEVSMQAAQIMAFILEVGGGKFTVMDRNGVKHELLIQRTLEAVKTPLTRDAADLPDTLTMAD